MYFGRRAAALAALALFVLPGAAVQARAETETEARAETDLPELRPLRVSAGGFDQSIDASPLAVSRIERAAIQDASLQLSLDESLQTVPGVFVLNPYNFAQDTRIAIRGFGARSNFGIRGIRLVVDGIPATTPDGQGNVDAIDLGSADSIEVLRGPASALYGASAGGVLMVETEAPPDRPFLEGRLTVGDYDLIKSQFKAGAKTERVGILASASVLDFGGYRDHSETESHLFNGRIDFDLSEAGALSLVYNRFDSPVQEDPGGLTEAEAATDPSQARDRNVAFDGGESVTQDQLGLRHRYETSGPHALEWNAYYVRRDFANKLPFESGGQVAFERDFFGGGGRYDFGGDRFGLALGFDLARQVDDRRNFDNLLGLRGPLALDQEEVVTAVGAFVRFGASIWKDLSVAAALRYDRVAFEVDDAFRSDGDDSGERRFDEFSPMIGLTWSALDDTRLFANVSTAFETPTTTELANPSGGGFNPSLEPERSLSFELGLRHRAPLRTGSITAEVVAFHIDIEDALTPFEIDTAPGRSFYRNAGTSTRRGIESSVRWIGGDGLQAALAYTWSDFQYDAFSVPEGDFSGNALPGIPEHFANFEVEYQSPRSGLYLKWNTRWTGAFFAEDGNSVEIDAYSVSNLRVGWRGGSGSWEFEPFIGFNNLFDEAYNANIRLNASRDRFYEPAPGRNLYAGLRIRKTFD